MSQAALEAVGPLPYGRWDRFLDRFHGRRGGRRRIPAYSSLMAHLSEGEPITAPYAEKLARQGRVLINDERVSFERRVAGTRLALQRMRQELLAAENASKRAAVALAAAKAPLTADELRPRNPIELNLDDEAVLRGRRIAMRDRRIAAAQAVYERRIEAVDSLRTRIAEAEQEIDQQFRMAQARAWRLHEHYTLRAATYWEAAALVHPEGRQLALLVPRIHHELPNWVNRTAGQVLADMARPTVVASAAATNDEQEEGRSGDEA